MKKKAFLLKDSSPKKHLNIVISDPDQDNMVLIVNITKCKLPRHYQKVCILKAERNHHPFIKEDSYVNFRRAREINYMEFLKAKIDGHLILKKDISDKLLKIIQNGARNPNSDLPFKYRKYFRFF